MNTKTVRFNLELFFHNYMQNKSKNFKLVNMIDKSYNIDPIIFDTFIQCLRKLPTTSGCVTNLKHYYLYYYKVYCDIDAKDRIIIYILPKQIATDLQKHLRINLRINKIVNIEYVDALNIVLDLLNKNITENFNAIELPLSIQSDKDNPYILLWDYEAYKDIEDNIVKVNDDFDENEEITKLDTTFCTENDLPISFENLEDAINYFKDKSSISSFQLYEWLSTLKRIKGVISQ